ncbi:hypothetical protein, partial [Streptomyces sp. NRRL S-104]|uniref:hypothetical protein n=1 Tax=Streptomyces sp. NRRL S-104 TaxID=1609135 RepID=UPI001F16C8CF
MLYQLSYTHHEGRRTTRSMCMHSIADLRGGPATRYPADRLAARVAASPAATPPDRPAATPPDR